MKKNVGGWDRMLRMGVGLAAVGIGFIYHTWWAALGLIPLLTGALGWCPAYLPFRASTRKEAHDGRHGPQPRAV